MSVFCGRRGVLWTAVWLLLAGAALGWPLSVAANQFVRLDYNLTLSSRARGTAFIELFDDRPLTRDNFMQYVNAGLYDGTLMHRLSRNFVLQGGGFYPEFVEEPPPLLTSLDPEARVDLDGNLATPNPTVLNEFNNPPLRSNLRGTISMAKVGGQPNSATNQWFVNLVNNQGLDTNNGGFTVFAQVAGDGMNLFDAYNGLSITNLNPDVDNNGVRDGGPFFLNPNDGVPFFEGGSNDLLLLLQNAERVDYFGAGSLTDVTAAGLTLSARNAYFDTGASFIGNGAITIGAGRTLGIREGFILTRPVVNQGTLAPGLEVGLALLSSYQQTATGTLAIQLQGENADTQYDRLSVAGAATLAGTLNVTLINNFVPSAGDVFNVFNAGSITGSFNTINLPALRPGLVWNKLLTTTSLAFSVEPDYQTNGQINTGDFVAWSNRFGDADPNLRTDGGDFLGWQRSFGKTIVPPATAVAAAIPEPGAILLAVFGILALLGRRAKGDR